MRPIAQARGVSVAQIALGWLLAQPQVTSVIIGAAGEQLADNIAAAKVTLSADELKQLDGVSGLPSSIRAGCSSGRVNIVANRSATLSSDDHTLNLGRRTHGERQRRNHWGCRQIDARCWA